MDWAIAGLRRLRPDETAELTVAVQLGKHGGDRRSEQAKAEQGDNVTLIERGNSTAYTLARLDRDRPDLAERGRAKELSLDRLSSGEDRPGDERAALAAFPNR